MDMIQLIIIFASIIFIAAIGAMTYVFLGGQNVGKTGEIRHMMTSGNLSRMARPTSTMDVEERELAIDEIKKRTGTASGKKQKEDISSKLFKAGYFSARARQRFTQIQIIAPFVLTPVLSGTMFIVSHNPMLTTAAFVLGLFMGLAWPHARLDKLIRLRQEETMYFLPLVIEQVSIGVSSSLDIGPCLAHIVTMADERDSHNPVTEMLVHVERLIRSGLNLEDALLEVGEASGMPEVKHAMMFLSQCAKHGGEVTKQLQDLADSVTVQRQVQVEARITALPVKATGPLATVFFGFFLLLFAGLLIRIRTAFGGGI